MGAYKQHRFPLDVDLSKIRIRYQFVLFNLLQWRRKGDFTLEVLLENRHLQRSSFQYSQSVHSLF